MTRPEEPAAGRAREAAGKPQGETADDVVLDLEDVTLRVRERKLLAHTNWTIRRGEQWAVLGPNGSGKSTLARTVAGVLPTASGHLRLAAGERIALVSFEVQADLYARELELDLARHFAGRPEDALTARSLLVPAAGEPQSADPPGPSAERSGDERGGRAQAVHHLDIGHLLDRPFRHLSAGEMRKALIARALASDPTLLVLDEPFDGLDTRSRERLARYLDRLMAAGRHLILVSHRSEELLPAVSHVLLLRDGAIVAMGARAETLDPRRIEELYGAAFERHSARPAEASPPAALNRDPAAAEASDSAAIAATSASGNAEAAGPNAAPPLVELERVTVRYGELVVLSDLSWRVLPGERWGVFGPNGSGKTTLLELIVGDNLQGYANDIRLFGRPKGSGESIWEIRRRIGFVTPRLQLGYRNAATGLEVVLSGLFDSIGLYRRPSRPELDAAHAWLDRLGIAELAEHRFTRLSNGQRRLLLIARAMVKSPELLILDEPCQGLDPRNRRRVLEAVDAACDSAAGLIYVTHHDDERPSALTHALHLSGPGEPAVAEVYPARR